MINWLVKIFTAIAVVLLAIAALSVGLGPIYGITAIQWTMLAIAPLTIATMMDPQYVSDTVKEVGSKIGEFFGSAVSGFTESVTGEKPSGLIRMVYIATLSFLGVKLYQTAKGGKYANSKK